MLSGETQRRIFININTKKKSFPRVGIEVAFTDAFCVPAPGNIYFNIRNILRYERTKDEKLSRTSP